MIEKSARLGTTERADPLPAIAGRVPVPATGPRKTNGSGNGRQMLPASSPAREIDFLELDDSPLAEMIENPEDPARTLLALWKDGEVKYVDKLEYRNQILAPFPRNNEILRRVRLPRGARPYKSVQDLLCEVEALISRCVDLSDGYVSLLASFVLSTWLVDRLPVAPYVSLVGMPQSGKTTLLKALSLVCRRPLLTADITSAAFYDACARLMPTLLIDETGTHGSNRYLRHLLRMGTTRDVVAMRKGQTFHAYGAKVICFLEPPDDPALNSRCIQILMAETNRTNLVKPTDPELEKAGAELQQRLLQFRFDRYKAVRPPEIPGAERLRPRARDLLSCLAAPCVDDPAQCQFLLRCFEFLSVRSQEPLSPPQNVVLIVLFCAAHRYPDVSSRYLTISGLTRGVNGILERTGERFRLQPRKVGSVLTSLGFLHRERTNEGWKLYLDSSDQLKIHQLAKTYGIDYLTNESLVVQPQNCKLCEKVGIFEKDQTEKEKENR